MSSAHTTTNPTDIIAHTSNGSPADGDNWAEIDTAAWIAAAAAVGITATERPVNYDAYGLDYSTLAGVVEVDGDLFVLTSHRNPGRITADPLPTLTVEYVADEAHGGPAILVHATDGPYHAQDDPGEQVHAYDADPGMTVADVARTVGVEADSLTLVGEGHSTCWEVQP